MTGAITGYIDVAQLVLYAFWIFFFGLVWYLHRETKREGYPLVSDRVERTDRIDLQGFPAIPPPKTFKLLHGGEVSAPRPPTDTRPINLAPVEGFPGTSFEPTGNPMLDNVGPGSWSLRADVPDETLEGEPKIVPLRAAPGFLLESRDPNPVGMDVIGCDGEVAGTVTDVWVDRSEPQLRYLEARVPVAGGSRQVLIPFGMVRWNASRRQVKVNSIRSDQFKDVPATKQPDEITFREEDQICAYYAAGTLYATPSRLGPLI